jgi:EpsI family protein
MIRLGHSWLRFALLLLVLLATFGLLNARNRSEVLPAHASLQNFPLSVGDWEGKNLPIDSQTRQVLGPGDYLSRDYFNSSHSEMLNLFIAFFPSQRRGDTIHSPRNCLPGSGWWPLQSRYIQIADPDGRDIQVNRYIVQKESAKAVVLYWYQARGRITPNEYVAKYYLVADAITRNRSDGALVRVTTLLENGETDAGAEKRAADFVRSLSPLLGNYIPR